MQQISDEQQIEITMDHDMMISFSKTIFLKEPRKVQFQDVDIIEHIKENITEISFGNLVDIGSTEEPVRISSLVPTEENSVVNYVNEEFFIRDVQESQRKTFPIDEETASHSLKIESEISIGTLIENEASLVDPSSEGYLIFSGTLFNLFEE